MSDLLDEHRRLVKAAQDDVQRAQRALPDQLWRTAIDGYLEPALVHLEALDRLGHEWQETQDRTTDMLMEAGRE